MMTTVSIDMGAASAAGSVTALGEAASCRLSEVGPDATQAFQQTLAEQAAANASLGESVRAALAAVGDTLTKVAEVSGQPVAVQVPADTPVSTAEQVQVDAPVSTVSVPVDAPVSTVSVPVDAPVLTVSVPVDAFVSNASVVEGTVRSDAIGTIASTDASVQLPELPQQIEANAALASDLTAATAVVGETLTKVAEVSGQPMAEQVPVDAPVSTAVQVPVDAPVSTVSVPVDAPVSTASVPVDAFVSNASLVEGTVRSDAIGTIASTDASVQTPLAQVDVETSIPETEDVPEANADALVAAGVVPQTAGTATGVEDPVLKSVSSVDAVSAPAATASVSTDVLVQAASAVADTLLVSPGLLRGQGEVLVQLRPDVLDGTEVKISVIGRQLEVLFQPRTVDMAVMIENCRTQLVNHLASKIVTFNVSVDVRKKKS